MKIKNLFIILLIFFACDNPINTNSTEENVSDDGCNIHNTDLACADNNSCQWINNECVTINNDLCTLNYGGVIDNCGFCSSGSTGIAFNKDQNICGECFVDNPSESSTLVFYDHDNNLDTPDLFCGCQGFESSALNDGCCGIIGSYNFFRDNNNQECNPDDDNSNNCINIVQRDECGVCAGVGIDEGKCDCAGNILDCLGNCGGDAVVDQCGVCSGDNSSCSDCVGIVNGGAIIDQCGICDGPGLDCNGECNGAIYDCVGECNGSDLSCFGCMNIYAENYDVSATIDDGNCIESSVTLFPDFSSITQTDIWGNVLGTTGDYPSECYNQDLYNNRTYSNEEAPYSNSLGSAYPNLFDHIMNISINLESSLEFDLFVIDNSNTIIEILHDGFLASGSYLFSWDGSSNGTLVDDGYYRILADFGDWECFSNIQFEDSPISCSDINACNYDPYYENATIVDENSCLSEDCSGNCGGDFIIDECGNCGGNYTNYTGTWNEAAPNGDGVFDNNKCDCNSNELDCFDVCGGDAIVDDCGICEGNNLDMDCIGICFGSSEEDCTGECNGNVEDCAGICGGTTVIDDCGVCNGPGAIYECGCDGYPIGACDCDGNVLDCQLVCGGNAEIDDCGICNGLNFNKDMCNICYGNNTTCTQGILTLNDWHFDYKSIWNNEECDGHMHFDYYNYICVEDVCYDYKLTFNSDYTFQFLIEYWDIDTDCNWLLDSDNCNPNYDFSTIGSWYMNVEQSSPLLINGDLLCLDYENEELEDFCFDAADLLNNYQDCIIDLDACNNNILFLTLSDDSKCYKEQYSTENYISTNNSNFNLDYNSLSNINKNIYQGILNNKLTR